MRVPLIAGNWKMNTTLTEAKILVREMLGELDGITVVEKAVCPPFISLSAISEMLKGTTVKLGAQNLYFEEKGAYTGEVSPAMLAELCELVIVGHSERRQYFGDTDEVVHKKIRVALKAGLKPILCVGESLVENESGKTRGVITRQLKLALEGIDYPGEFIIAYEPIWAIGTGRAATAVEANETIWLVRATVGEIWGEQAAQELRVLYGGSVNADNAADLMCQAEIDGALVGGASLKAPDFISIVRQTAALVK